MNPIRHKIPDSNARKRASRVAEAAPGLLDPRFRGGDEERLRESSV
jgi:hypothetical protein